MRIVEVNICFWLSLFLSINLNGQEMKIPIEKEIKIVNNDSLIIAHVLIDNTKSLEVDDLKRYYWFNSSNIASNIGGYYGKLLHGNYKILKDNHLVVSGTFKNGLKIDTWSRWRLNGEFLETIEYKDGVKHGDGIKYNYFGDIIGIYSYKNGNKNGKYKKWDKDGLLIEKGRYKSDKKNGRIVSYDNNRNKSVSKYRNGVLKKSSQRSKWWKSIFKKDQESIDTGE